MKTQKKDQSREYEISFISHEAKIAAEMGDISGVTARPVSSWRPVAVNGIANIVSNLAELEVEDQH